MPGLTSSRGTGWRHRRPCRPLPSRQRKQQNLPNSDMSGSQRGTLTRGNGKAQGKRRCGRSSLLLAEEARLAGKGGTEHGVGAKEKDAFWSVGRHPRGKRRCEWFEFLGDIIRPALLVPHSALCSTGWLVWAFGPWLDEHAAGMVPAGTNKDCKHSAVADNHCGDAVRSKCRGNLLQSCISAGGSPETSKKMCI